MKYKARSSTSTDHSLTPTNSSPSSQTTSSSMTTSYTPTNTKPPKSSHVSQHAFSLIKSNTPWTKPRSTVDHHMKVTLATPTRNAWSMSRICALYSPFSFVLMEFIRFIVRTRRNSAVTSLRWYLRTCLDLTITCTWSAFLTSISGDWIRFSDLEDSHVIPGLIHKCYLAKSAFI